MIHASSATSWWIVLHFVRITYNYSYIIYVLGLSKNGTLGAPYQN